MYILPQLGHAPCLSLVIVNVIVNVIVMRCQDKLDLPQHGVDDYAILTACPQSRGMFGADCVWTTSTQLMGRWKQNLRHKNKCYRECR